MIGRNVGPYHGRRSHKELVKRQKLLCAELKKQIAVLMGQTAHATFRAAESERELPAEIEAYDPCLTSWAD